MDLGAYLRSKLDDFKNTVSQTASNIESGIGSFAQDQYNRATNNPNFVATNDFFIKPFVNTVSQGAQAGLRLATEHPYVASALQLGPIAKVGQIARKTNPTFNSSFNNYGAQSQLGDLGKVAGMAGALFSPEIGVGAGAFQAGTSALGNYFTGNGANNTYQNLLGQYNQGFDFGSKLGPIGAAVERIPGINTLAPKITAKLPFKAGANLLGNIGQSVAKEALTGGIYGGLNNEDVLQSAGGFAPFGLAGPLAGGALKGIAKGLKNSFEDGGLLRNKMGLYAGEGAVGFEKSGNKFASLADKKTRFEISDRQAFIKSRNVDNALKQEGTKLVKLGDILNHEGLYKQYPNFKRIRVIFNEAEQSQKGSFDPQTFTIKINSKLSRGEMRSTLLHEVQHAIQKIEGFAKGGNLYSQEFPDDIQRKVTSLIDAIEVERKAGRPTMDLVDELQKTYTQSQFDSYRRLSGEIEARDVQAREALSPEQRKTTQPYASQGIPLNKQVVNFGGGLSENAVLDRSNAILDNFQKATDHIDDFNMKGTAIKSIVDEKLTRINQKSMTPEQLQDLKATRAALNKSLYGPVEDEASRRMAADMKDIPEVAGFYNDITDSVAKIDSILKGLSKQKGFEIEPNFITSKDKRVKPVMDKVNPYIVKMGDTQFISNDRKQLSKQVGEFLQNQKSQLNPVQNATRITAQNGKIKVKLPEDSLRDLQKTARPNESVMQQDARLLKNLGGSDFVKQMDALGTSFNSNPKGPKVPKQEPRGYTQEDTQRVAGVAQLNADENFKGFLKLHDKWIGQRDVAKTSGYEVGAKFKDIPKESGPDVIKFIENPTSQAPKEIRQYADGLRKSYDELYNSAQKAGIDMGYLKNYITHIWDRPSGEVAQLYKAAKQRFNFANERVLPTYEEGIKLGLTPKYSTPQQIIAEYARKLEETKANVDFFNTARKEGFVVDATIGSREPGFSPLVGPGFPKSSSLAPDGTRIQGYYYAPTKIADQINRIFSPQDYGKLGAAVNLGKKISATIQDVTLSGGLPGTALNAFTIAQAQKEALSGRIVSPLTSLFRSVSPKMSEDYFNRNIDTIKKMQANNIPLSTTLNVEDLVGGLNANGVGGKLKQLWNKSVNDPTFKRFMPMLQINLFKDIENQALKGGVSAEEATAVATQAVKNFYGVTGSGETARRNKFAGDVAGTFLFAPKFRESMINFWVNSVKALKNPLALENRANVKFLAGATLTYAAMNAIQKQTTGKFLWENPDDKKDKMLIPLNNGSDIVLGVPFLSSIATVPRNIATAGIKVAHGDLKGAFVDSARAFGSTTAKLPAELIANQDYFGNQIYNENDTTLDKYKKMGAYTFKSLNHPYVKAAMDMANSGKSGPQIASETLELPLRFYKQKSIDSSYYFDAVKKSLETLDQTELSAYKALPSSKLFEAGDPQKAIVNANILLAYPKVFDAKRQAQIQTANGDTSKIDPLYLADDATVKKYLRYQTLPPGSSDKKDMYAANPEIGDLAKARSEYFTANPLPGGNTSNKPLPSDYVQKQMDAKNWKDPEVRAYLDANTAYNNDQRAKLGLPPLAGFASFPKKASAGRKVGKVKVGKVKKPKIKLTKVNVKNIKVSKLSALKVPKYKPLKIA